MQLRLRRSRIYQLWQQLKNCWEEVTSLSMRSRLTVRVTLLFALSLVVIILGTGLIANYLVNHSHQQFLKALATQLSQPLEHDQPKTSAFSQELMQRYTTISLPLWIMETDGSMMMASQGLARLPEPTQRSLLAIHLAPEQVQPIATDGQQWLVICRALSPTGQTQDVTYLHLAQNITATWIIQRSTWLLVAIALPGLIVGFAALVWFWVGRSLAPIYALAAQALRSPFAATAKEPELRWQEVPAEIRPLAIGLQQNSTNLANFVTYQTQLINQISHELRTPLSLIYGYLQSLLRRSNLTTNQRLALETAATETQHTVYLLQNLLEVARTNLQNLAPNLVAKTLLSSVTSPPRVQETDMPPTVQILLVEDEEKLARFIQLELTSEGYQIRVAHDGMTGLALARELTPDLVILDWMLPGMTGVEVCRRLRSTGIKVPIILLTARDEISDRVAGLDAGADDYVVKPFSIEELLARIRAHLRRNEDQEQDILQFEDLRLNRRTREVLRGDRAIELTAKEFDLLDYLLNRPRQVFTRDQILEHVWGYDFMGDSNIIEVYVRYLRLKLEEKGEKRLIHTIRGVGYALRD